MRLKPPRSITRHNDNDYDILSNECLATGSHNELRAPNHITSVADARWLASYCARTALSEKNREERFDFASSGALLFFGVLLGIVGGRSISGSTPIGNSTLDTLLAMTAAASIIVLLVLNALPLLWNYINPRASSDTWSYTAKLYREQADLLTTPPSHASSSSNSTPILIDLRLTDICTLHHMHFVTAPAHRPSDFLSTE